jgi:hypothetical protein
MKNYAEPAVIGGRMWGWESWLDQLWRRRLLIFTPM